MAKKKKPAPAALAALAAPAAPAETADRKYMHCGIPMERYEKQPHPAALKYVRRCRTCGAWYETGD